MDDPAGAVLFTGAMVATMFAWAAGLWVVERVQAVRQRRRELATSLLVSAQR